MSIPSTRSSTNERLLAVVKVGGSLFDLPELGSRLQAIISQLADWRLCFVAGGGALADVVRSLQPIHGLKDSVAHRMAMSSLRVGERLLCELVPGSTIARNLTEANDTLDQSKHAVIQAAEFVSYGAQQRALAENWDVTSDSIAAWVAGRMDATKLLLLKSTDPPDDLRHSNRVDAAFFDHLRVGQSVAWCNLRAGTELVTLR